MELEYVYILLVRDWYDQELHIESVYKSREDAERYAQRYYEYEIRKEILY